MSLFCSMRSSSMAFDIRPDAAARGFRRPERVEYFAQACEADARGRLGLEDREYKQSKLLVACSQVAQKIDTKPLLEQGYTGLKLADQISRARTQAIAHIMHSSSGVV